MRSLLLNDMAYKLGIRIYCNKCKGTFDPRKTSKVNKCAHPSSKQMYKSIVCKRRNGAEKKRMTCTHKTRNLSEAIEQGFLFKKHVKSLDEVKLEKPIEKSYLLTDCLVNFIDYKRNIGVSEKRKKSIQPNSFNAYQNHIKKWMLASEEAGENFLEMRVDQITERNVSYTISYLGKWSSSIQRKAIGFYNQFYSYLNESGYNLTSPFKGIEVAEVTIKDARGLTLHEFKTIKEAMINGSTDDKVNGKIRYFDWLPDALTFNALTGRRREEFMMAKFSDIVLVDGNLLGGYIKMIDFKYSRQNSHKVAFQNRITKAPIYPELYNFLVEMGYEKYKNTDRYIIAGDEKKQRDTMANNLTNGFSFYRKKAGLSSDVQLNGLRKKYITRMRNEFGDNANFFTGHKSSRIDMKHYYDDKELFEKVKSFVLWK